MTFWIRRTCPETENRVRIQTLAYKVNRFLRFAWPCLFSFFWGLYCKTFYGSNFCRIVLSLSVCHCQSLPPQYSICRQGMSLPECSRLQDLTLMVGCQPYSKYQTRVEVNCGGKHSSLLRHGKNYCRIRFQYWLLGLFGLIGLD